MSNQSSPGWEAIDKSLVEIYNNQDPEHYAPEIPFSLGGSEPLEGVSVYYNSKSGFYHYVTYGLTELHEKESENKEFSGWGFELTFKLKSPLKQKYAPKWPISLLQSIAKLTFNNETIFDEFHTLSSGPVPNEESTINGLLFVLDNQLGERKSVFGKFKFLQVFGLTENEFEGVSNKTIDRRILIANEKEKNMFLLTDMNRA